MGDAREVIGLLERFEMEAALLLTLKAIESVNGDDVGYDELKRFPIVSKRHPYPDKKTNLSERFVQNFALMLNERRQKAYDDLSLRFVDLVQEHEDSAEDLCRKEYFATLERSSDEVTPINPVPEKMTVVGWMYDWFMRFYRKAPSGAFVAPTYRTYDLSAHLSEQLRRVRELASVTSARLRGDVLLVRTSSLEVQGLGKRKRRWRIPPLKMRFSVSNGQAYIRSSKPETDYEDTMWHTPNISGWSGSTFPSALSQVIPQLLGTLELETAVSMAIGFVQETEDAYAPKYVLSRWKA